MTHKEIKKEIHSKLEAALVDLKSQLGEKKFNNRVKKAAKLLTEGLGKEEKPEAPKVAAAKAAPAKKTVAPTAAVKKAAEKKSPVKKTIIPVAKKTVKAPVTKKKVTPKTK
ncbi:MAG: hypothetical protein WC716_10235 [Chitinophagaceae bacterium]|jgi:hypothetical protein